MSEIYPNSTHEFIAGYISGYINADDYADLHIILDDLNVEDQNLKFCAQECVKKHDAYGASVCGLLLGLDEKDRINVIERADQILAERKATQIEKHKLRAAKIIKDRA